MKFLLAGMGSGGTPDTDNADFWASDEPGTPWVAIGDLSDRAVVTSTAKALTPEGIASKGLKVWPIGTLLFSMYASLGHTAELTIAAATNQAILALLPSDEVNQRFLCRWLEFLKPKLKEHASSNTQDNLNAEKVGNLFVLKPPLREQATIAAFLDREIGKIDALIAEQEKLIALLAEKRSATIAHAVTRGLNPDAPMKDSGVAWLGRVPAHWDVVRLGALFREVQDSGWGELPVLSVSIHHGVSDKELEEDEMERKVSRSEDRSKYKEVWPGDLTYNMMRAWQGGFGAVTVHGMVSPAYVVARPTKDFQTSHIEQLLRTPRAVSEMKRYSRGITDFRLRLYWDEFKVIQIALPPKMEQSEISAFIYSESAKVDALMTAAKKNIKLMQERRGALIAAVVTGQVDVRHT
ncbi:restriction endonuclease subunit S [Hydrogenophaga sp.]|uniref:restriction endonuclease subunit S n=1 Tax=Hydrogenophaga sp. TaxID=1904254 RepID=UPI002FC66175